MSEQQIEGMPDGWRLMRIGTPNQGDYFINAHGTGELCVGGYEARGYAIIEKIERPKRYRPFANAAEFEPHRDRWFNPKSAPGQVMKTTAYNEHQVWIGDECITWQQMFEWYTFESGTPFGVEVTE